MAHPGTEAVEHDIASAADAIEANDITIDNETGELAQNEELQEDYQETEEVAPEEASETQEPEQEQDAEPVEAILAPVSWSPEQKEMFSELPPEIQSVIVDRESARDRGFQQKATELAEQRKAINAEQQGLQQERLMVAQYMESQIPPEPDINLLSYDPNQYHMQKAQRDQQIAQLNAVKETWRQDYETQKAAHLEAREPELNQLWPDSMNEGFYDGVTQYAEQYGFSKDSLDTATAPELMILDKARRFDELMAQKPSVKAKVEKAPKVQKPGTKSNPSAEAQQAKYNKFRKSGSIDDAAAVLRDIL